jgi:RsiW-degrading membrane proteinase PrsW (M82 family)
MWWIVGAFLLGGMTGMMLTMLLVMADREDDWKDSQ